MKHIPHLVVGAPWDGDSLELSVIQWRHLTKVLRLGRGDRVTYTDGLGTVGEGVLTSHAMDRGPEKTVDRPNSLTVAVAAPASKDRQRFLVEKLAEVGAVERLLWLETRHGKNRVASPAKVFSWVLAATEQSRGAWLMDVSSDVISIGDLAPGWVACHPGGDPAVPDTDTVVIGPESGFGDDELPADARLWDLGPTILRVETAALVAVAKLL